MKEDCEKGWWEAPAGTHWTCPGCKVSSLIEDWEQQDYYCEDCGEHDGRKCPVCEDIADHVWGAERIAKATEETNVNKIKPLG
jgi:hypothetical protein